MTEVSTGTFGTTRTHEFTYDGSKLARVDTRNETGSLIIERIYTYDGPRIAELQFKQLVDAKIETTKFTYEGSVLTSMDQTADDFGKVTTFAYDDGQLSRVMSTKMESGGNVITHLFEYRYDSSKGLERQTQTIENRDLNFEGTNISELVYDSEGLLVSQTSYIAGNDPFGRTYVYDSESMLSGVEAPNDIRWRFDYNTDKLIDTVEFVSPNITSETFTFTYENLEVEGGWFNPPVPVGEMFDMTGRPFNQPTALILDLRAAERSTFIPNQPDGLF